MAQNVFGANHNSTALDQPPNLPMLGATFDSLPQELLLLISIYLDLEDLVNFAQVRGPQSFLAQWLIAGVD
jgi:hypothetical protein